MQKRQAQSKAGRPFPDLSMCLLGFVLGLQVLVAFGILVAFAGAWRLLCCIPFALVVSLVCCSGPPVPQVPWGFQSCRVSPKAFS